MKGRLKGWELDTLSYIHLDTLRKNLRTQLLSEYYDSDKEITIPIAAHDIEYLSNYSISIDNFTDTSIVSSWFNGNHQSAV